MTHGVRTARPSLRIAMVAPCVFPSPRGSQVLIRELAQTLADRGHAVHLIAYPYGESLAPIRGIFVHRARPPRFAAAPAGLGWRKVVLDVCLASTLRRVVQQERIEVIHAHNYEGPLISYFIRWVTRVPVVYHSHNALSDELAYHFKPGWRRSLASRLGEVLDRQIPRRADFTIALTPQLERFVLSRGVTPDRVAVIPPAPPAPSGEPLVFQPDPFAARFVVMYAGNLDPYQDLNVLFRGFALFQEGTPNALLVVVTHEPDWKQRTGEQFERLLRAGHACVVVAPAFSVVRRFLRRADVLVCPRSSWSGFPMKLLNYMVAGRAVIAAAGSAKGLVDGDTGVVIGDGDVAGLAAALRRLSADDALRTRLGENARAAADAAPTWNQAVAQIERIYAQVCAPGHAGRLSSEDLRPGRAGRLIAVSGDRISATSRERAE